MTASKLNQREAKEDDLWHLWCSVFIITTILTAGCLCLAIWIPPKEFCFREIQLLQASVGYIWPILVVLPYTAIVSVIVVAILNRIHRHSRNLVGGALVVLCSLLSAEPMRWTMMFLVSHLGQR